MKARNSVVLKLTGIFMILAAAVLLTVCVPKTAYAAKKYTAAFTRENVTKVKTYSRKFKVLGSAYDTATWNLVEYGWYTFKINSKTKYRKLVNTETGKTKKVSKKTALKNLKKKKFITVYITFKSGGTVTQVLFGV